jgi:SAM-dependent methyltransferase
MPKIKENFSVIKNCRLCKSKKLSLIVDFGSVPLGNNLQSKLEDSRKALGYPLKIMQCQICNHFQLSVSVSPKHLYATNYTYLSGIGNSFVKHLRIYTDWVIYKTNLKRNSLVIDVGSNDGTLLSMFKNKGFNVCGVDPAEKPSQIANKNGIPTYNNFFDKNIVDQIKNKFGKADLVLSQNVLAHVEDLQKTFVDIYNLLKDGAYFVFEIGYFKKVVESGCFDTIYHEHLDYHHALPLSKFLTSIGFDLLEIEENDIQGGSLRLFLQKTDNGKIHNQAAIFIKQETQSILYDNNKLLLWQDYIKSIMVEFNKLVYESIVENTNVIGYGAPTKAILLMKMSKINPKDISYIVDDNALKINKYIPFYGIPIKPTSQIDINKPTVIIIFAWNFYEDIIAKIKPIFKAPIKIIIPLPKPKVYT